eukprot:4030151-Prymnesium_polylepis.2
MRQLLGSSLEVLGGDPNIQGLTRQVRDGDELALGGCAVRCLHTPCHTSGHISYVVSAPSSPNRETAVFTGDILFVGGCGRFFEGTPEQMVASAAKLAQLPAATAVYCGHEYTTKNLEFAFEVEPQNADVIAKRTWAEATRKVGGRTVPSTIGEELKYNPFMRVGVAAIKKFTGADDDVTVMRILRNKKDTHTHGTCTSRDAAESASATRRDNLHNLAASDRSSRGLRPGLLNERAVLRGVGCIGGGASAVGVSWSVLALGLSLPFRLLAGA